MIPEWLKSSKKHQAGILLAGLALWQFKRQMDNRNIGNSESEGYPYPMSEYIDGETIFVWPTGFDEHNRPRAASVGLIDRYERVVSVVGILKGAGRVVRERRSESNRAQLRDIKAKISQAKNRIEERVNAHEP